MIPANASDLEVVEDLKILGFLSADKAFAKILLVQAGSEGSLQMRVT